MFVFFWSVHSEDEVFRFFFFFFFFSVVKACFKTTSVMLKNRKLGFGILLLHAVHVSFFNCFLGNRRRCEIKSLRLI